MNKVFRHQLLHHPSITRTTTVNSTNNLYMLALSIESASDFMYTACTGVQGIPSLQYDSSQQDMQT